MRLAQVIHDRLPEGSFIRNVLTLMTGTVFAQALTLVITPVLTRIYTPDDFGVLGLYTSIIGICAILCCGRYELAIVLPERHEDASSLVFVSILWTFLFTIIVFVIVNVWGESVANLFESPTLNTWLWLLPINVFFYGVFQTLNYWNTRFKHYQRLATRQITQSSITAVAQLGFGFLTKIGAVGLITGQLIGLFCATTFLIKKFVAEDFISVKRSLSMQRLRIVAAKYKKYPIFNMIPSVIDSITVALPVMFFTKFFDFNIAGQYSLGVRLLYLPASLIGTAVAQVYFQKIAEEYNKTGKIDIIVRQMFRALILIAIPFCFVVMVMGPWLFSFFFGSNWTTAGEFCRILAPAIGLKFAVSPLSGVFGAVNKQDISAIWQMTAFVVTIASLGLSLLFHNAYYSVSFLMISDLLVYSLYLFLIFRVSGVKLKKSIWEAK